jgi:DNA-binding GntR family transcriptional regulator
VNEPLLRTMSGQIVTRIRNKILSGDYAPGTALLQDSIAAEFGVSKIPVREALVRLRAEGLIDIEAHRGFRVRPLLATEVDEVFRLRLALEPGAVGEGAKLAKAKDHIAARESLRELSTALSAGSLNDIGNLNSAFHLALIVPHRQPVTCETLSAGRCARSQVAHRATHRKDPRRAGANTGVTLPPTGGRRHFQSVGRIRALGCIRLSGRMPGRKGP